HGREIRCRRLPNRRRFHVHRLRFGVRRSAGIRDRHGSSYNAHCELNYPVMKSFYTALAIGAALAAQAAAQKNPFLGRWDLTVSNGRSMQNQWMELVEKEGALSGRIQPGGGASRPIVAAKMQDSHLIVTVQAAGRGPEVTWDLTVDGNKISG